MKLIGYDASGRDTQRYHHAIGCEDQGPSRVDALRKSTLDEAEARLAPLAPSSE